MILSLKNWWLAKRYFLARLIKGYFWFLCGVLLGLFFFTSFSFIIYQQIYSNLIYPGVYIDNIEFGGKTKEQVKEYFSQKNEFIQQSNFQFKLDDTVATVSAKDISFGYDSVLLGEQVYSVGRASNVAANFSLILQSYLHGVFLPASYRYDTAKLVEKIEPLRKNIYKDPIDARFTFQDGKVVEFQPSAEGEDIDFEELKNRVRSKTLSIVASSSPRSFTIPVPLKTLYPQITTDKANSFGIRELIGSGSSLFTGSIPNRIFNITLAATRLNGILIKPGETFSFDKSIGDISAFTGYKQAYVIQNGRTVLGDGGGVCQVSTTIFRAVLNSGLPIIERNPHAYRVGYYEQDSGPGFDAAIFVPNVDFKFKNDTDNYLLIKTIVDPDLGKLTFELYGTKDLREVKISKPVITSVTSSPEPLYIDDPTLPKNEIKQVDYAVPGANVYFTRQVIKDGKTIINETFSSRYRAWQAVYMRGTKE